MNVSPGARERGIGGETERQRERGRDGRDICLGAVRLSLSVNYIYITRPAEPQAQGGQRPPPLAPGGRPARPRAPQAHRQGPHLSDSERPVSEYRGARYPTRIARVGVPKYPGVGVSRRVGLGAAGIRVGAPGILVLGRRLNPQRRADWPRAVAATPGT